MNNCNFCGALTDKKVCDAPKCQNLLIEINKENMERENDLKTTHEIDIPGFFGGLMPVRVLRCWDEVHDDGIVYRHYLKENKTQGCISSSMSRFEFKKAYERWLES